MFYKEIGSIQRYKQKLLAHKFTQNSYTHVSRETLTCDEQNREKWTQELVTNSRKTEKRPQDIENRPDGRFLEFMRFVIRFSTSRWLFSARTLPAKSRRNRGV